MEIVDHKLKDVKFVPTNKMGGTIKPEIIVMHFTAGWTTEGDIDTLSRSKSPVSAHLVLSREGVTTQIVPFNRKAWHAGPSKYGKYENLNNHSIGIEISNIGYLQKLPNGEFMDEYGNVILPSGRFKNHATRRTSSPPTEWKPYNHPRLAKGDYVWEPFTPAQIATLDDIVDAILETYDIKAIVTHEEIDTRKWKSDPGPQMPMHRYTQRLAGKPFVDGIPKTAAPPPFSVAAQKPVEVPVAPAQPKRTIVQKLLWPFV